MVLARATLAVSSLLAVAMLTSCGGKTAVAGQGGSPTVHLTGTVHGGQQPVVGATIQLYAVGGSGDGSTAQALISSEIQTSGTGTFDIDGSYQCSPANSEVYLVATEGNPGLSPGTQNTALAMMTALGPCNQLGSSTYIAVNELTTVGSLAALYPYATTYSAIGSGSGDASALATAFTTANEYMNPLTGAVPGPALPTGYYASSTEIDTLADVLASCVNSAGGTAGQQNACGNLFTEATPPSGPAPSNTIDAVIDILKNPTNNVADIFDLTPAGAPFLPKLSAAPSDWTLPILQMPATPTFSPPGGSYSSAQSVTINETTTGATVYYTTDGSTPTAHSTLYSSAVAVNESETINAIAIDGRVSSDVATAAYAVPPPQVTTVQPAVNGTPESLVTLGNFAYASVQGTGQVYTYNTSTGYLVQSGTPYQMPCADPSGMVIASISGANVMAVVCNDTNALVTLTVNADGSLTALGSVNGLAFPFQGIVLDGTNVYVPLYGVSQQSNGGVARVSIATPSAPVITGTVTLASPQAGWYANPDAVAVSNGTIYVAAGSESGGTNSNQSSTIQMVNEATMSLVGSPFVVDHSPQLLTVVGNVLYVTIYDFMELDAIDVTNPGAPVMLQSLKLQSPACSPVPVLVTGTTAYLGCYAESAVEIVDVTQPANMTVTRTITGIQSPEDMTLQGKYLLVTGGMPDGRISSIDTTQ